MSSPSISYPRFNVNQWDFSLEGKPCPLCKGKGFIDEKGDIHRSAGTIPCPFGYFQGHGYPICSNGKLRFLDHDMEKKHES